MVSGERLNLHYRGLASIVLWIRCFVGGVEDVKMKPYALEFSKSWQKSMAGCIFCAGGGGVVSDVGL